MTDADQKGQPLTERILGRLGRPRRLWIARWSAVPLLSPVVFATAIRLTGASLPMAELVDLLATQVGLSFATLVLLVGTGVFTVGRSSSDRPSSSSPVAETRVIASSRQAVSQLRWFSPRSSRRWSVPAA
jgi:hypothetical protein